MKKYVVDREYCETLRCIDWAVEKKKKRKDAPPEVVEEKLPPRLL